MKYLRNDRLKLLSIFVVAFALLIVGRLYVLQVMRSSIYVEQADRQYVKRGETVFDRGSILMTSKDGTLVSAATLRSGYTIALNPKQVIYPEDVVNALEGVLDLDQEVLFHKLSKTTDPYEELAKRIDEKTAKRIEGFALAGINAYKERWRHYPGGSSASHVLGFVGYDEDNRFSGRYGLERYYDDVLSRDSDTPYANFFVEIFSDIGSMFDGKRAEGDIVTTLEPRVTSELERAVDAVEKRWNSDTTGGIIMDPTTGEIYAMVSSPNFDPNDVRSVKNASVFANPLVERVYEMGSIVKPLAMAAALDAGVLTPETTYDDKGSIIVNTAKISNFDGKARGITSMQQVLSESLNVGMAYVTQRLGNEALTKYFMNYGFGEETGIDLPGEVPGLVANLKSPRDIEHVTASFGQGIAITPIETVRALSALGNGGILPNPHIVRRIDYLSGVSKTPSYTSDKRVLSEGTSEAITRMLVTVVDKALVGGTVKLPHYSVAAKTGTAQIPSPEGGYYKDRYLHSFFGYFPAYDPKFIVFLYTVYPKGAEYASHTLTEPFIGLVKFLINYYDIDPDR